MIRRIFSAKSARPRVQASIKAIVQAATYMSASDGTLRESEIDALVESVKQVAEAAVGVAQRDEFAPTPLVLDWARQTARRLKEGQGDRVLADAARVLAGDFRKDALFVAFRVIAADGRIKNDEDVAFRRLMTALGVGEAEADALSGIAIASSEERQAGRDVEGVAVVKSLAASGWWDPFDALRKSGVEVSWYDAALQYSSTPRVELGTGKGATLLRLDLDARDRVLHLHVTDEEDKGPHVIVIYRERLRDIVEFLDSVKDALKVESLEPVLAKLRSLTPDVYLEQDGQVVRVGPKGPSL